MQKLLFTKRVKNYDVKVFIDDNGQNYFNCTCIYSKTKCLERKVPCKHCLSVLFTNGDCSLWEKLRDKFTKHFGYSNVSEAEISLAKGLRSSEALYLDWFTEQMQNHR
jgi:hypothetical protein